MIATSLIFSPTFQTSNTLANGFVVSIQNLCFGLVEQVLRDWAIAYNQAGLGSKIEFPRQAIRFDSA
jgi:hypothetical protein